MRGPGFTNLDASVSKIWNLNEKLKLQFRAEFFNLLNHPNFSPSSISGELARSGTVGVVKLHAGRGSFEPGSWVGRFAAYSVRSEISLVRFGLGKRASLQRARPFFAFLSHRLPVFRAEQPKNQSEDWPLQKQKEAAGLEEPATGLRETDGYLAATGGR
jgi:hypothetical protein